MNRTLKIALLSLLGLLLAVFSWAWFAPCGLGGCAPVTELERFRAEGSELLDARDRPFARLATVNRRLAVIDSLPGYLPRAFIAIEDRRFYDHHGVDWRRAGGALIANLRHGGVAEGGSTITMQLARNLFPEHLPYRERSVRRKLMEIRVARQIERAFPKQKILELYLNHIYLGEGAYGVEAAAQEYFGKPAGRLTLAEAATIGGLGQLPSRRNPRVNREGARRRRDEVLRAMATAGFITPAQADSAAAEPLRLAPSRRGRAQRAPWFVERVRQELEERMGDRAYTGGLRVYTTFDPTVQDAVEAELARQADAIESGAFGAFDHPTYPESRGETEDGSTPYLQGAAVVMEARSGAVLALVGGRDFEDSKFDRVFQAVRQPGSAFKPFVYLAALEQGIPPTERVEDAPVEIRLAGGEIWRPRNYTGRYDGAMTLREALTRSKNTVTVRLAQRVGMDAVAQQARELGISTEVPLVPSAALGAAEVRPIELATAYAAFANGGTRVVPHLVRRVETRDGEVIWEAEEGGEQVLDEASAFVLTSMLRDVVDRGSGSPARAAGFRGAAAGKTGTTNRATDVWFVGYTPDLVGSVWFGFDRPQPTVRGASGGTIAAPVWGRIMSRVYASRRTPLPWSPPGGVVVAEVDRATGLAMDPECPTRGQLYTEYFIGTAPPRPFCAPDSLYPYPAMDTVWRDDEWGTAAYESDTIGLGDLDARGIDSPTLEAQRRSGAPPSEWEDGTAPRPVPRPERRTPAPPIERAPPPPLPEPPPPEPAGPPVLGTPVQPPPPDSGGA